MNLPTVRTSLMLAGLLAVGSLGAEAQQTRTVRGLVRDSTSGETLPFAAVSIRGRAARTTSNRDGYFTLIGVPADSFTLRVTAPRCDESVESAGWRGLGFRPHLTPRGEPTGRVPELQRGRPMDD